MAQFLTEDQIKQAFNINHFIKSGNIIQVWSSETQMYHYLVENCHGWSDTGMTSINPDFFVQGE